MIAIAHATFCGEIAASVAAAFASSSNVAQPDAANVAH